jgi:exopolysaccharide production protein ExoZ
VNRLLSIQYLRAVAVLMVLGYHACLFAWRTGFEIGAAGVDVFFVISGFILWTIAAELPVAPGAFLRRRLLRVAPLYWIATLAVAAIAWRWPSLIFDAQPTTSHLALSLGFIHHLNPAGRPNPVLPVGWSLNNEALFYLIFAACLFARPEHRFRWLAVGLGSVILLSGLIVPTLRRNWFNDLPELYYLGYSAMFLQFLAGAWIAQLRLDNRLPSAGWGVAGLIWSVAIFAILDPLDLYEDLLRPLLWGAPAAVLVWAAVTLEARRGLPVVKTAALLGDASYSIYLIHWPVMSLLTHALNSGRPVYVPLAVGLSLAAGIAVHLVIERPLLKLFHAKPGAAVLPSVAT